MASSRAAREAGRLPGPGEYLVETGYVWPLLGFCFACALLWRSRQRAPCEPASVHAEAPPPPCGFAPARAAPGPGLAPPPAARAGGDAAGLAAQGPPAAAPQGMVALAGTGGRAPDLATRLGAMTARKVAEVERLLLRELEESLLLRAATVASLFHTWRCEAAALRTCRELEEEFERQRGDWERHLEERRRACEGKLLDTARVTAQRQVKWRQALALLLDQWSRGDDGSLQAAVLDAWRGTAHTRRALRARRHRIQAAVGAWAEGDCGGSLRLCLRDWRRQAALLGQAKRQQAGFDQARESRDRFLHEEAARHAAQAEAAWQALGSCRARARKDVLAIAAEWSRGDLHGLALVTMQAWRQRAAWARAVRQQRGAARGVLPQLCEGASAVVLRSWFSAWRGRAEQERALRGERSSWSALAGSQHDHRSARLRSRDEAAGQHSSAMRRAVALAAGRWGLAETGSLLCEVLAAWRGCSRGRRLAALQRKALREPLLRWAEGEGLGTAHDCLLRWKAQAAQRRLARQHGQELGRCAEEWEALVAEERARCEAVAAERGASAERRRGRAGATVSGTLVHWERGQGRALLRRTLRAWQPWARGARRVGRKRSAVRAALRHVLGASDGALLHACALGWCEHARQVRRRRAVQKQLDEETSRWAADLESQREGRADALRVAREGGEARRRRGHEAARLLARHWQHGDAGALLAAVLSGWLRVRSISALLGQRRQSIRAAVLRFCEGDERAAVHVCLLDWRHRTRAGRAYRAEVLDRDASIRKLQEGASSLLAREQARLLEYARLLTGTEIPALALALLAAWRALAAEARAGQTQHRLHEAVGAQRRQRALLAARRGRLAAAALELLGCHDGRGLALGCFLRWAHGAQAARRGEARERARRALQARHEQHLQLRVRRQDRAALLAACFWELLREARLRRQAREREGSARQLEESMGLLGRLREERFGLEEQLRAAYRQADLVTETLQKELRTKEELAAELREVYDKLRKQGGSHRASTGEAFVHPASRGTCSTSRPSSAKSDSLLPHLPASVLAGPAQPRAGAKDAEDA